MAPDDVVRHAVVDGHVVELADRQRRREPGLAAVHGDIHAAVVGSDHALRVLRVDPEVVVIAVAVALDVLERLAAVDALEQRHLGEPDHVGVRRVDGQVREVPGPLAGAPGDR